MEDNTYEEAVVLIKDHYKLKDDLYDFRQTALNSYDESLSSNEKLKLFKKEHPESTAYLELIELVNTTNVSKLEYLKIKYPEHFQKKSRQRQNQRFIKGKAKAIKIRSN